MTMTKVSKTLRVGFLTAAVALSGAAGPVLAQGMGNMGGMNMQGMGSMPAQGQGMAAQGQGMAPMRGGMMPMMMGMMPMMPMAAAPMANAGVAAVPAASDNAALDQQVDELNQAIAALLERIEQMEAEAGDTPAAAARATQ